MPHNLSMRWLVHAERMNLQTRMRMRWWGRTTKGMGDSQGGVLQEYGERGASAE
jgi:hypothetical protein